MMRRVTAKYVAWPRYDSVRQECSRQAEHCSSSRRDSVGRVGQSVIETRGKPGEHWHRLGGLLNVVLFNVMFSSMFQSIHAALQLVEFFPEVIEF